MAGGETAPRWFTDAISAQCESRFVDVQKCAVHYLHWQAKPITTSHHRAGMIFIHGNGAHAHWWSWIAPFFTAEHDCIAVSNSGSGQSGWREEYSFGLWAAEILAAAKDAGMLDERQARCKPVVVAHSLGVAVAVALAEQYGSSIGGMLLVDEIPRPPQYMDAMVKAFRPLIKPRREHEVRPGTVSPRSKFSLAPRQLERNRYMLDFVADKSVTYVKGGESWVWSFDPQKNEKLVPDERVPGALSKFLSFEAIQALTVRLTFVVGDSSAICFNELIEWNRRELGQQIPFIEISDAAHHIMFDQPLALVAAIRATLVEWRRSEMMTPGGLSLPRLDARASHSSFVGDGSNIELKLPWMQTSKL